MLQFCVVIAIVALVGCKQSRVAHHEVSEVFSPTSTDNSNPTLTPRPTPTATPVPDLVQMVQDVLDAVVQIKTPSTAGTGFIISADGLILTNAHVVEFADNIIVTTMGGKQYPAEIIGTDKLTDIALLKIQTEDIVFSKLEINNEFTKVFSTLEILQQAIVNILKKILLNTIIFKKTPC